jgi:hypothetical protein
MKLKAITYGRKVTDNNYGSYHLEVVVELEEGDTGAMALATAKEFVRKGLREPKNHSSNEVSGA